MEGLRARVERRASRGVWFGYRTGQGYALKVEAPIQRRRAHLARADDFTTRDRGQLCLGRLRTQAAPKLASTHLGLGAHGSTCNGSWQRVQPSAGSATIVRCLAEQLV